MDKTIFGGIRLCDFERIAYKCIPSMPASYFKGASGDELTCRGNVAALDRIWINPDYLSHNCGTIDMTTKMLNTTFSAPIGLSPTACHKFAHADGELATGKGAADAGCPQILSSFSHTPTSEVVAVGGNVWSNVYMLERTYRWDSRDFTARAIKHAEVSGAKAIVVTCDIQVMANKATTMTAEYATSLPLPNLLNEDPQTVKEGSSSSTWEYFGWICKQTVLPVVAKGVLNAKNAVQAVEHGAAAVIVSNHGGRQLDQVKPSIEALPEVVAAVGSHVDVYIDGGFRSGYHVFKALALGAKAVFIGRPQLWGLAVGGAQGVQAVLEQLKAELRVTMINAGTPTLAHITRNHVILPPRCACSTARL